MTQANTSGLHGANQGSASHGGHHETFPWKHIIGYVLSLILTILAFWIALKLHLSVGATIATILALAIIQMAVQLFMFMHITERIHGDAFQKVMIYSGIVFAAMVVIGTIWVMTFKSTVS
jgi:cytochrome aa3 quinol oxidase subunit IV